MPVIVICIKQTLIISLYGISIQLHLLATISSNTLKCIRINVCYFQNHLKQIYVGLQTYHSFSFCIYLKIINTFVKSLVILLLTICVLKNRLLKSLTSKATECVIFVYVWLQLLLNFRTNLEFQLNFYCKLNDKSLRFIHRFYTQICAYVWLVN